MALTAALYKKLLNAKPSPGRFVYPRTNLNASLCHGCFTLLYLRWTISVSSWCFGPVDCLGTPLSLAVANYVGAYVGPPLSLGVPNYVGAYIGTPLSPAVANYVGTNFGNPLCPLLLLCTRIPAVETSPQRN
jgi:hypothetical protein